MSNAIAATAAKPIKPPERGLFWGVLVSLLLHALLLSLQFGIPGLRPGPGGPLTVHLAPLPIMKPGPPSVPELPPAIPTVPPLAALPATPAAPAALPALPPTPRQAPRQAQSGFTLLDPARPQPAPPPLATRPPRAPRRRARPRTHALRDGLHTKVIAQQTRKDDSFAVPPAGSEPARDVAADLGAKTADLALTPPEPDIVQAPQLDALPAVVEQPAPAGPTDEELKAERERLAAQREQQRAARREAEEQALQADAEREARRAADQQTQRLAQEAGRYEDELASRQRQADEEAQRQMAARERAEQERARQLAEQQRVQAEQQRAQQLAEQQRIQAEQARAQQLAEQQRIQAEQARAQQLAEQQRAQAEQLARENAEQAERLARQEQARLPLDGGIDALAPSRAAAPGGSGLDSVGRGAGALPRTALDSPLATRARELLRGIDIDKPVPQAVRPAEDARRKVRRAQADAVLRDVPLRMYVDSIRQKIERNAIVSPSQLAGDAVRIFPIVSITVRSDGSIEDVTIVRSSGRPDIDEVVRRIVHLNARYAAFPPNVAANYDAVELRRVWSFAGALRLLEEMR